jgi:hypothetical protein
MLKTTYEAVSIAITRKELLDAVRDFLLHSGSHEDVVLADNIYSPKFGSSDLLFVNKARTTLTVARLNDQEDCEKFIISSISYYFWLKEFITVSEAFLNGKSELDMYLFSHDFSAAIRYLMDNLTGKLKVYPIKYNILQVEDLTEPAIYFQHMTLRDPTQDKPVKKERQEEKAVLTQEKQGSASLKISAQESREFDRLKELYLQ